MDTTITKEQYQEMLAEYQALKLTSDGNLSALTTQTATEQSTNDKLAGYINSLTAQIATM